MPQSASSINYRLGSLYSLITAFLYATQEPFSFPAASHLSTLQFVCLTQIALLVSVPLLMSQASSRRDFVALLRKPANYGYLAVLFAIGMSGLLLYNFGAQQLSSDHHLLNFEPVAVLGRPGGVAYLEGADPDFAGDLFRLLRRCLHWRHGGRLEPA